MKAASRLLPTGPQRLGGKVAPDPELLKRLLVGGLARQGAEDLKGGERLLSQIGQLVAVENGKLDEG